MAGTWEDVHLCVWCVICFVVYVWLVRVGGVWGGSVTPGGGPLGECLRAKGPKALSKALRHSREHMLQSLPQSKHVVLE